ncbi:hypothetical protein AVEN_221293-1 [Araneus ventricosus]|uniref:Uncharacterized protein n=1 Tax=Araneus ventricosus TaxID=182803 RepID=A0A4Y2AZP2_ARAVE|nr:hypothetical protein AVEN_221293-1 [Araneus ventricosus]
MIEGITLSPDDSLESLCVPISTHHLKEYGTSLDVSKIGVPGSTENGFSSVVCLGNRMPPVTDHKGPSQLGLSMSSAAQSLPRSIVPDAAVTTRVSSQVVSCLWSHAFNVEPWTAFQC